MPFPVLWLFLVAVWLLLAGSADGSTLVTAALVALAGTAGLRALEVPRGKLRRPRLMIELAAVVVLDMVRSNIAVGRIVVHRRTRGQTSGFLDIPLRLTNPAGLAVLACIVTATPGTSWARYDSRRSVLTLHILDLVDEDTWLRTITERYEQRLLEIFQ